MPNWCENSLTVKGEKNEVKNFYEKGLEKGVDKKEGEWRLFPYHPYKNQWNYDWCCENWGTKWDVYDLKCELIDGEFSASFLSAWAPPVEWLKKVQSDYPTLTFELEYNENGMQFKGIAYTINKEDGVHIFDEELVWVNPYGGKVRFSNIEWDTDGQGVDLPKEVILEVMDIDDDFNDVGADILSDKFGFCVHSFNHEIKERNDELLDPEIIKHE